MEEAQFRLVAIIARRRPDIDIATARKRPAIEIIAIEADDEIDAEGQRDAQGLAHARTRGAGNDRDQECRMTKRARPPTCP